MVDNNNKIKSPMMTGVVGWGAWYSCVEGIIPVNICGAWVGTYIYANILAAEQEG